MKKTIRRYDFVSAKTGVPAAVVAVTATLAVKEPADPPNRQSTSQQTTINRSRLSASVRGVR